MYVMFSPSNKCALKICMCHTSPLGELWSGLCLCTHCGRGLEVPQVCAAGCSCALRFQTVVRVLTLPSEQQGTAWDSGQKSVTERNLEGSRPGSCARTEPSPRKQHRLISQERTPFRRSLPTWSVWEDLHTAKEDRPWAVTGLEKL